MKILGKLIVVLTLVSTRLSFKLQKDDDGILLLNKDNYKQSIKS